MGFSLNYNEKIGSIEVKYQDTIIDTWPKHSAIDFNDFCIVGDKDSNSSSYHNHWVPDDGDRGFTGYRVVVDVDAYQKSTSDNSTFCCVYVGHHDISHRTNNSYTFCRSAKIYNQSGLLTTFEGPSFRCGQHHFMFIDNTATYLVATTYLVAATGEGVKVFKLSDYDDNTEPICWKIGCISYIGVTPVTPSGKRYFFANCVGLAGGSDYLYLLDYDRFVKEVYKVEPYTTEMRSEQDFEFSVNQDKSGLKVGDWYRDRVYPWDDVVKFGSSKLLWYESCVVRCLRHECGSGAQRSHTTEADYLVTKLFSLTSPSLFSSPISSMSIMAQVRVGIDDGCKPIFSQLCQYRKPTVLMLDQPYSKEQAEEDHEYYAYDHDDNFLTLYDGSVADYLKKPVGFTHTVKVAVFDDAIPSLTDYFENYNSVITANNTLTITGTIVFGYSSSGGVTNDVTNDTITPQLILQISKAM